MVVMSILNEIARQVRTIATESQMFTTSVSSAALMSTETSHGRCSFNVLGGSK